MPPARRRPDAEPVRQPVDTGLEIRRGQNEVIDAAAAPNDALHDGSMPTSAMPSSTGQCWWR
jgi:hypothetical protein